MLSKSLKKKHSILLNSFGVYCIILCMDHDAVAYIIFYIAFLNVDRPAK